MSDSQVVFDGARIAATLNACNEGDDVINSESRRNILVAHLVCTLKRCFGEAPSRGHDAESSSQISSTIEASSRSGVIFDCDETFTELNQNYDLAGEFPGKGAVDQDAREATNGSHKPTQSAPNTWAVLQAINQSCVFPAIAQIHERLAESSITRSPVLDERTDDAWTVDIFIGGAMDSSVLVRHRRRMRSSDPEWPFRALWQLDISFSACGGDHPQPRPMKPSTSTASTGAGSNVIVGPGMHLHLNHNDESTADYDADACANVSDVAESSGVHVQPIECVGGVRTQRTRIFCIFRRRIPVQGLVFTLLLYFPCICAPKCQRLAVVECSFEFSPNEGQASRKVRARPHHALCSF